MKIELKIARDEHVRTLVSPGHNDVKTMFAYVPLDQYPDSLPISPDPRIPKPGTVERRIKDSLKGNDGLFHLLNRGVTVSAQYANYDNKSGYLTLIIPEDDWYGILDGGHTDLSIRNVKALLSKSGEQSEQFVKLEILVGVEQWLGKIASARNFSKAVKEISLANYNKELEWFKAELAFIDEKWIKWSENNPEPFDALEYIQVITAFDIKKYSATNHPLEAYKNAGKCLEYATSKDEEMLYLSKQVKTFVTLYDTVRLEWWEKYNMPDESGRRGRGGNRKEVKGRQRGVGRLMNYPALNKKLKATEVNYHVEKGLVIPLVAAFRSLLEETEGELSWKADPFQVWNSHGSSLVRKIMDASAQRDNNPHVVGRDSTVYEALYDAVELTYLRDQKVPLQGSLV
jgi:hypothetical protein